ncbi:tail fiber assembly protein [Candidatus Symbiopectobacterium sp. NZEC127]|uniref:tail fiber assembly protein n=1 Tax=Candidatus Symbiopectobacterium sp. NZEC127 TaxID=2820472 RepID=UPI0022261770|nr:tail fiber assembly protein [Candidatus Symbiopectobacterium sp. NZEC127]MCW2485708.1 tail fiber assembly protein [Candidatus Symbiopectobacterium sp. NZEC127]
MSNYSTDIEAAELGKNGLSKKAGWITVYHVNQATGEYQSASMEYLMLGVGLPAYSYPDEPELPPVGQALHRSADGKSWAFSPDYRGQTVYNTETRQEQTVTQFGDLPDNVTLLKPESDFDVWDGKKWVLDEAAQAAAARNVAEQELASRKATAASRINELMYAVNLDMATDEEKSALTEWQKYAVLLSRVDVNAADIEWPEQPE